MTACESDQPLQSEVFTLRTPCRLSLSDYVSLLGSLHNFPLSFFGACCEATPLLTVDSLEWMSVEGAIHRSYNPEPVTSKTFQGLPSKDASNPPIHTYGYSVRLRTCPAWKVPILYGKCPASPDGSAGIRENKKLDGLFLMPLFRLHRRPNVCYSPS